MKKKHLIMALFPLLAACSNTELPEDASTKQNEVFSLEITYDNQTYNVPCTLDEKGNLVYLDKEFKELYDTELSKYPNLATFDYGDHKIAYFPTQEDMFKELGLAPLDDANDGIDTRATEYLLGEVTLWDDTGYKDRSFTFQVYNGVGIAIRHLKPGFGFNDKTSALKVWSYLPNQEPPYPFPGEIWGPRHCIVFCGYEDNTYQGRVLCCVPENRGPAHEHPRLKDIGWNDKITSIKFQARLRTSAIKPHD